MIGKKQKNLRTAYSARSASAAAEALKDDPNEALPAEISAKPLQMSEVLQPEKMSECTLARPGKMSECGLLPADGAQDSIRLKPPLSPGPATFSVHSREEAKHS